MKIYISTAVTAPTIPSSFTGFTSSINESNENTVSCTVYPTFAEDNVWIKSEETPQNVQLMDLNGGIVLSAKNTNEINVSNLQEGLYLMVVTFEKSQSSFKIINYHFNMKHTPTGPIPSKLPRYTVLVLPPF